MAYLAFEDWDLEEWLDPKQASCASADSTLRALKAIAATRLLVQRQWFDADRGKRREMERFLDDLNKTGVFLMAILRTERELAV